MKRRVRRPPPLTLPFEMSFKHTHAHKYCIDTVRTFSTAPRLQTLLSADSFATHLVNKTK